MGDRMTAREEDLNHKKREDEKEHLHSRLRAVVEDPKVKMLLESIIGFDVAYGYGTRVEENISGQLVPSIILFVENNGPDVRDAVESLLLDIQLQLNEELWFSVRPEVSPKPQRP